LLRGWDEEKKRELNAETQRALRRETQEHRQECLCHMGDFGFGNKEEDGLVRGAGFVMIWMFLVSRGYSAASCSATQRNCCARIHSAFPGY